MPDLRLQKITIAPSQLQNQQILLTSQQQHYLMRVLRLQAGDRFIAMNGQGCWWLAKLEGEQAQILESIAVQNELPVTVTLMVALPKGNGFDEVVRQATALGVTSIMPVISDRTLLHPSPQKLDRWRRIAAEAAEQSERQILPTILEPISFTTSLRLSQELFPDSQYICVPRDSYPHLLECLQASKPMSDRKEHKTIAIATGPEGGWTDAEVQQACAASFQPVSLGRRILTAVLAPIVALSVLAAAVEMGKIESEA